MEAASQEILFEHPSSPIAVFKRIDVSQLNIDWNKLDSVDCLDGLTNEVPRD